MHRQFERSQWLPELTQYKPRQLYQSSQSKLSVSVQLQYSENC